MGTDVPVGDVAKMNPQQLRAHNVDLMRRLAARDAEVTRLRATYAELQAQAEKTKAALDTLAQALVMHTPREV